MIRTFGAALAAAAICVLAATAAPEAVARDRDPVQTCERYGRQVHQAHGFRRVSVRQTGGGRYEVEGLMERRRGGAVEFHCTIQQNDVWRFTLRGGHDGRRHDGDYRRRHDGHHGRRPQRHGAYSPDRHITCYPAARECYYKGDRPAPDWTRREFGHR